MFALHDKTRRRICLAVFLLVCMVPTALVVGWSVVRQLPWRAAAEADRLSWRLGHHVSLDDIHHPRPGTVHYEGLTLSDPETLRPVLHLRSLEATWKRSADPSGTPRGELVLSVLDAEIEAEQLKRLFDVVQHTLCQKGRWPRTNVSLIADGVVLRAADGNRQLTDVAGRVDSFRTGPQAEIVFRMAGVDAAKPTRIRIVRTHQEETLATAFDVDTGGGRLPCSLMAQLFPKLDGLGDASHFQGRFGARETPGGWEGGLNGQLTDVDLESLIAERFPHRLTGLADVTIQDARFLNGRLETADGWLAAGPGEIGPSLISAAVQSLGLVSSTAPAPGPPIPYLQLATTFAIDASGLKLQGGFGASNPGTILTGDDLYVWTRPNLPPRPIAGLLRMLAPSNTIQVPASRHTDWLMCRLPIVDAPTAGGTLR